MIQLTNIYKSYVLRSEKPTIFDNFFNKNFRKKYVALDNVSLTINKEDKIGIIGPNGAGKTTLLKIISGIATPNSGAVTSNGKLVSLIDLEAGFHPDLTGKENIFLNGLIVGMSTTEIKHKLNKIINFAGIDSFINEPLYTYSSGMKLRLGFSIAVHSDPDILILDEGISVGDEDFKRKSARKIQEFFDQKKTVLIVSHWLEFLEQNCNRIIWIENGKIKQNSTGVKKTLKAYRRYEEKKK